MLIAVLLACQPAPAPVETHEPTPAEQLDAMDDRRPVPMPPHMALHQKEQMRDHLAVMQQVTAALAVDDWAGVRTAARRLGTSKDSEQTCEHMGAAADGFTPQALELHAKADAIVAAAEREDAKAVLAATAATLDHCVACHATWRQQLVTGSEYSARADP